MAANTTINVTGASLVVSVPLMNVNNGGGNASLTMTGGGLLVLNAADTYTGTTTITNGTIQLGNVNALQSTVVTDNMASGGMAFSAGLGTANLGGLSGSGNIALADLSGGSLTLNLSGNATTTYSGVLSGPGGLTNSSGVLTLTNSLTNYVPTSITGGALVLGNTSVLPLYWTSSGAFSVSNTGTFGITLGSAAGEFTPGNITTLLTNVTFPAGTSLGIQVVDAAPYTLNSLTTPITGPEGLNKLGAGDLVIINNGNTYTGTTTVTGGTLQLGNGTTSGTLSGNVTTNATLAFDYNSAQTFGGTISGVGGLAKIGSNVLDLTASNNYTGGTNVSAGTLELGNANAASTSTIALSAGTNNLTFASSGATYNIGALSASSTLSKLSLTAISGGSITLSVGGNGSTATYSGLLSGAGGLTVTGGSQTLFNANNAVFNTFSGNVNINGGALLLSSGSYQTSAAATILGNMTAAGRTINVNNGGTLAFLTGNTMGDTGSTVTVPVIINQGGEALNVNGGNTTLGPVVLNGGTLADFGNGTAAYQPYNLGAAAGSISATGSANSTSPCSRALAPRAASNVWRGQYVQRLRGRRALH